MQCKQERSGRNTPPPVYGELAPYTTVFDRTWQVPLYPFAAWKTREPGQKMGDGLCSVLVAGLVYGLLSVRWPCYFAALWKQGGGGRPKKRPRRPDHKTKNDEEEQVDEKSFGPDFGGGDDGHPQRGGAGGR